MLIYLAIATFFLFNFVALYSANSYKVTFSNFFLRFLPITILDGILFFAYFFFFNYDYEIFALLGVFFVYVFQFVLFVPEDAKYKYAVSVYYSLATLLPFYAMRLFLLGYFAYEQEVSIPQFLENPFDRTKILFYSLLIASITKGIYLSGFCVKKLESVMKDYKNLAFLTRVLIAVYVHALFMSYYIFRINDNSVDLDLFAMKVGVCYIAGYFIMLVYAIVFDMLRSYQHKLMLIKKTIHDEQLEIEKLQKESVSDPTTGLKIRSVAIEVMEEYLEQHEAFYVIFVDMDGLKHANDVYGHEEGDFYIKSVANILREHFLSDTVVRYGGDEFLIVGEVEENSNNISRQIQLCREKVIQISRDYNKEYNTSFSFGIVEVEEYTNFTISQILEIADTRMYEYKKRMKKTRQVVDISSTKNMKDSKEYITNIHKASEKKNVSEKNNDNNIHENKKSDTIESNESKTEKIVYADKIPEHIKAIMEKSQKS